MSEKERNDAKKDEEKHRGNRAEGEGSPKGKRILLRTFGWPKVQVATDDIEDDKDSLFKRIRKITGYKKFEKENKTA